MKTYLLAHWSAIATALLVLVLGVTMGCASLSSRPDPIRLGVTLGIAKLLENSSNPEERAANITNVVGKVLALLEGNPETTVELLAAEARRHIPANASPVDRALYLEVIRVVGDELKARVSGGVIPRDKVVAVRSVLQWVLDGADFGRAGRVTNE